MVNYYLIGSGNFLGQLPYISGNSCSQCSQDRLFCVNNACCKFSSIIFMTTTTILAEKEFYDITVVMAVFSSFHVFVSQCAL